MLPGVGGEELIRILRLRNEECGVLVITGKAEAGVFENVLTAGADMHLGKPVSLDEHRRRLAERFARQDANRDGYLDARELAAPPR